MSQCGTDSFEEFAVTRESVAIEEIKAKKTIDLPRRESDLT